MQFFPDVNRGDRLPEPDFVRDQQSDRAVGLSLWPVISNACAHWPEKDEVAEACWSEIDLAKKLWMVPAERMKADAAHLVPLAEEVLALLRSLPRFLKGDHLFSTDFGKKPVNGFSKGKARLDSTMAAELGKRPEPFVIHDIRRTMRTGLSALPIPDIVREVVIAHSKPGLHKVYDQFAYSNEKRRALELWGKRLLDIVGGADLTSGELVS